jgi:5-methyltetrahydrofolate--homocysteine methyltransferase
VIELAKKENVTAKFMIGGAVVNQAYADEIGAVYSKDAYEAVKLAQELAKK